MKYEDVKSTETGFYPIYRFMERELSLRGSELRLYALIFSFSAGRVGMYYGSRKYLADSLSISERTVYRALKSLFERGLIENVYDMESGRSGVRASYVKEEAESTEKLSFIERCKNNALDGYVKREYGSLCAEDHRIVRAAAEDRFRRQSKERELDEQVKRIMRLCREQKKGQTEK